MLPLVGRDVDGRRLDPGAADGGEAVLAPAAGELQGLRLELIGADVAG